MSQTFEPEPQLIDLREFLRVLRRRWFTVALVTVAVVGLAAFLVWRRAPVYTATARVEVRPLTSNPLYAGAFYDLQAAMDTEAERVTSADTRRQAEEIAGEPIDGSVSTSVPANTTYIDIACTTSQPEDAQDCANAYARAYASDRVATAEEQYVDAAAPLQDELDVIDDQLAVLESQLASATTESERASILSEMNSLRNQRQTAQIQLLAIPQWSPNAGTVAMAAQLPTVPSNKGYVTTGILALIVGLAMAVGLAFVRERLDERVPDREGFERALGAPVLAAVPRVQGWRSRNEPRLVSLKAPDSAAAESYRAARTNLLYQAREGEMRVIAVTGPGQAEGKTTTTVNLAVALAQAGKRVVAVSADLRKPRMHRFFKLTNVSGTSDVLTGHADMVSVLTRTDVPNLLVMTSGPVPANPAELLASDAMDDLLAELRNAAEFVLIDTPPTLVVSDTLGLAPKVDGVIVVADASSTHLASIEHLRHQLERGGGTIIGGIFNNLETTSRRGYGSYGYRDDYREKPSKKAAKEAQAGPSAPETATAASGEPTAPHANGNGSGTRPAAKAPEVREPSELGF
jgi:non-specific protein-tyrosine kinase